MDEIKQILLEQIKEIDSRDETQVLSEIAGEMVTEMIYETTVKDRKTGKMVKKTKLSWVGTKEAARSRGNIVVDEYPQVTDAGNGLRVIVKVTDLSRNFSIFGGCHQPYQIKVYDFENGTNKKIGEHLEDDPYTFQKGLSKAQRNALQTILPADYIAKCIGRFLNPRRQLPAGKAKETLPQAKPPALQEPNHSWYIVKQVDVPDFLALERIFWNRTKKQPKEMYQQLGATGKDDVGMTPWEAFLTLKKLFVLDTSQPSELWPED